MCVGGGSGTFWGNHFQEIKGGAYLGSIGGGAVGGSIFPQTGLGKALTSSRARIIPRKVNMNLVYSCTLFEKWLI